MPLDTDKTLEGFEEGWKWEAGVNPVDYRL